MKKIFLLFVALLLCIPVLAKDMNLVKKYIYEGKQAAQARDYDKMHSTGTIIIKKAPNYGYGYLLEAQYLFNNKKYAEAIPYFTKAVELQSGLEDFEIPLSYYLRAVCYFLTKKWALALEDFNRVETYNVDYIDADYYVNKALCYGQIKDYDNGIKSAQKAKQLTNDFYTNYTMDELIKEYSKEKLRIK